jgi:hypothetical protein
MIVAMVQGRRQPGTPRRPTTFTLRPATNRRWASALWIPEPCSLAGDPVLTIGRCLQDRRLGLQLAKPCGARKQRAPAQAYGVSAMKLFDWLTGTKRPAAGVSAKMPAEVRADLLAVNRPTAPFIVRDGAPENVDLVAEWRIVDATWYEIFAKAGLAKVFKILIKLDEQAREVRAVDQEWSVEWRAGVPVLSLAAKAFRGQTKEISFGTAFAFTEQGSFGEVYRYKFSTAEIKTPLQDAVTKAGWIWRSVSFGKL